MKIAVGLSGGVDSTMTASLLKEQGHEVIGLTMKLWDENNRATVTKSACFGPDELKDIDDLKRIASKLEIPLHVIDLSKEYSQTILSYFQEEYLSGRTPNPCVRCNQTMKFNLLLKKAYDSGINFDMFATGHYARIIFDESKSRYLLKKGLDPKKDQSYFLVLLKQEQLSKIIFPLGEMTKEKVKLKAKELKFGVHEKKESQDFYSGNYIDLISKIPETGNIIHKDGKVLGSHKGICFYTIGQRKGLGVSYKEPLYVININKATNSVIVGSENDLFKSELIVSNINWIAFEKPLKSFKAKVRVRYLHKEDDAEIIPEDNDKARIIFDNPQRAISPGQYAAFFDDDTVLGGGIIDEVIK